jgi:hypothetical protein
MDDLLEELSDTIWFTADVIAIDFKAFCNAIAQSHASEYDPTDGFGPFPGQSSGWSHPKTVIADTNDDVFQCCLSALVQRPQSISAVLVWMERHISIEHEELQLSIPLESTLERDLDLLDVGSIVLWNGHIHGMFVQCELDIRTRDACTDCTFCCFDHVRMFIVHADGSEILQCGQSSILDDLYDSIANRSMGHPGVQWHVENLVVRHIRSIDLHHCMCTFDLFAMFIDEHLAMFIRAE